MLCWGCTSLSTFPSCASTVILQEGMWGRCPCAIVVVVVAVVCMVVVGVIVVVVAVFVGVVVVVVVGVVWALVEEPGCIKIPRRRGDKESPFLVKDCLPLGGRRCLGV